MQEHNQILSDIQKTYTDTDILNLLPVKKTRERLKTEMLRVDHAGEFGAVHIYTGQISVLQSAKNKHDIVMQIQKMQEQEQVHLNKFNEILPNRRIRPSLLSPMWHLGGFLMGATTALISDKSAMACTEAVETVIDKHYETQIDYFSNDLQPDIILDDLKQFQQDELDHKNEAIDSHAVDAPFYKTTKYIIESLCHSVIKLAHKI